MLEFCRICFVADKLLFNYIFFLSCRTAAHILFPRGRVFLPISLELHFFESFGKDSVSRLGFCNCSVYCASHTLGIQLLQSAIPFFFPWAICHARRCLILIHCHHDKIIFCSFFYALRICHSALSSE